MRDLVAVIDEMLEVIPESEAEIRAILLDNQSSASFTPPEGRRFWWREVGNNLQDHFSGRTDEVAEKVSKIITNS